MNDTYPLVPRSIYLGEYKEKQSFRRFTSSSASIRSQTEKSNDKLHSNELLIQIGGYLKDTKMVI